MKHLSLILCGLLLLGSSCKKERTDDRSVIANEMKQSVDTLLAQWYPRNFDREHGGFLSTYTFDWKPTGDQDKMIVTQARHTWSNAVASAHNPSVAHYREGIQQGVSFLRKVMWDSVYGGFYTLVDRKGVPKASNLAEKNAYGNAFGIYALARAYLATHDTVALNLAQKTFAWLESHSHDPVKGGYFMHLDRKGNPIDRPVGTPSTSDLGYKDQNSSIHLLEAFTELYQAWPDSLLGARLQEMLVLVRDTITTDKGYLTLFLTPDWTPVSFRDSSEEVVRKHHNLDHVSFGHDVETAYLLLEASHVLGIKEDQATAEVAKRMVDHALMNGWDNDVGGFFDEGYYFKDKAGIVILKDTKNWWAQAEALNTLSLMADLYPEDPMQYFEKFKKLWGYVQTNLIDHEHGDWYAGGLDKEPDQKTALKGHIWKGNYHQLRSMLNCIERLSRPPGQGH